MKNETFFKSVAAICHPFSITALLFLLLNDQIFRRFWPSWWTGKFGDITWLFFAPFLLILLLSLFLNPRRLAGERWVTGLAYVSVGVVFAFANTNAAANALLTGWGERLLHVPLQITLDPTDLFTLPVLLLSLGFWSRVKPHKVKNQNKGLLLAVFGGLLTIANMAAPQYGVDALRLDEGQVIACAAYDTYTSKDGGLTWELDTLSYASVCQEVWDGTLLFDFNGEMKEYRFFFETQVIESSTDGGKTWFTEYVVQPSSQAEQIMQEKTHPGNAFFQQGPLDAVFDPMTGSLVFAMGLEGVLVRTADGEWQQIGVGEFQPMEVNSFSAVIILLGGELLLALGLFLLFFSTAGIRLKAKVYTWILLILGWLGWLGVVLLFQPAVYDNYPIPLDLVFSIVGILIVPLGGYFIYLMIKHYRMRIIQLRLLNFVFALLFVLPYFLWAFNIIPEYGYAMLAGLLVAGLGAYFSVKVIRRIDNQSG